MLAFALSWLVQKRVLQTKNTESMVFSLSMMGFVVSFIWFCYGYLLGDFWQAVGCETLHSCKPTSDLTLFRPSSRLAACGRVDGRCPTDSARSSALFSSRSLQSGSGFMVGRSSL